MYKLNVVISLLVAALASNAIAAADLGTPPVNHLLRAILAATC
jgi:hypothetical protein